MRAQKLDRTLTCYRTGDPDGAYPIFDATASRLYPGRWNTPASPMIYASENYSTAMLEKLVHGSGQLPPNQHFIKITVPHGAAHEMLNTTALPDWYVEAGTASKAYGEAWQQGKRSLILIVPSVVARVESNILINPEHPEFPKIETSLHQPVWCDKRLFAR